jgi:hypothetical protein
VKARLARRWDALAGRHPWLRVAAHWSVSVGSLASGVVALLVFRRGLPDASVLIGYLLLLWLVFVLLTQVRAPLEARGRRLVLGAVDYTMQTLEHYLFLFVLPAFYVSATLTSVNAWFVLALAGGAVLTAVDPWYRRLVRPRRWAAHALLGFAMFAALKVALPLVGLPPFWALHGAAVLCALGLLPALRRAGGSWRAAALRAGAFAALAVLLLASFPEWVPPAPLHLSQATMARDVVGLEPVGPFRGGISEGELRAAGGLAAFTPVYAPVGLRESIVHVWKKDGLPVTTVPLSPIRGGRAEGFRTFSRKRDFGEGSVGRWEVDVVTGHGQLIGRLRFRVTP